MLASDPDRAKRVEQRFAGELSRLRAEVERVKGDGREVIARAEGDCRDYRLATGELYSFELLGPELGGWPRGRLIDELPRGSKSVHRFGFDARGELAYVDDAYPQADGMITVALGGTLYWVSKLSGRVEATGHNFGPPSKRVEIRALRSRARWSVREYQGTADRCDIVVETQGEGIRQTYDVTYDEAGRMQRVVWREAQSEVWARKAPKTGAVLAWLETALRERIAVRIVRAAGDRAVYALVLAYSGSGDTPILPPELALGLVEERDQLLGKHPENASDAIWDPRLMYGPLRHEDDPALIFDDADLLAVASELDSGDDATRDKCARLLVRMGKALNKAGLPGLRLTSDFVVYAADLDRGDWVEDMRRCTSKTRVEALRRAGRIRGHR